MKMGETVANTDAFRESPKDSISLAIVQNTTNEKVADKHSEYYLLGSRSPFKTLFDLATKQQLSYLCNSIVLILIPFLSTKAITNSSAVMASFSVSGPYEYISQMAGWFFQLGGSAMISRFIGKKEVDNANILLAQILVSGFLFSLLVIVILIPSMKSILKAVVDKDQGITVINYSYEYIIPLLAGTPLTVAYYSLLGVFMGCGKMSIYLCITFSQMILANGILAPIFLFCTNLKMTAPSLAQVISYIPMLAVVIFMIYKKTPIRIHLKLIFDKTHWFFMKDCMGIGVIDCIQSCSGMIVMATIQSIISKIGRRFSASIIDEAEQKKTYEDVLAAWGCLSRFYQIVVGMSYNTTGSYLTASSYAIGARRHQRFYQLSIVISVYDCLFIFALTILIIIIAPWISRIYGSSDLYLELATAILRIFCITGLILPLQFIVTTFCQAAELYKLGVIIALITQIFMLPALFIMMFYCTKHESPRKNFYLSMVGFNLNDVISGIISVISMFICLKKLCNEYHVKMNLKTAFQKTDIDDDQLFNPTSVIVVMK